MHRCSKRANAIAPNDTFVLTYLAAAHCNIGDYAVARHYIEKSIRLNPNHRFTLNIAAMVYAWLGETEASLAWLDRYMETAPLSLGVDFEVAFEVYYLAERYEDAIAATAGYAEISLNASVDIAAAYAQAGHLEKAAELRRSFEANKPMGHSFEAHAEAILRLCA